MDAGEKHLWDTWCHTAYQPHLLIATYVAEALQICAGHDATSGVAIHIMKSIFDNDDTHAAFFVDATDVFDLVNRQAALNMSFLCPSFSTIPSNAYGASIRFFITGEDKLSYIPHLLWLCMPLLSLH